MSDFQVIRRKGKKSAVEQPQELTQEDQSSLLSKAGAGAMSGLHTFGSILSWPSRLVHGAINAAVGGKEGFGENYLNPFDSRGGVEGSRHLINAGVLAENNPNEWEWGDLGRGVADLALDPTTYMGPGLTKIGRAAEKQAVNATGKSALVTGTVASHAAGHRALLNVGLPFADPILSIGTGPGTAKALESIGKYSGLTRTKDALGKSWLANHWRSLMDARHRGISHGVAQKEVANASDELAGLKKNSIGEVIRFKETPEFAAMHPDDLRMGLEGVEKSAVQGGYVPHPAAADEALVPHVMMHINPQGDINKHFADAAHNGLMDDAIQAGQPIHAQLMHLDEAGMPVLGKGMINPKSGTIKQMATKAFDDEIKALQEQASKLPMWADDTAKATDPVSEYVDWYIKTGGKDATPEQIQFLKNNHGEIEKALQVRAATEKAAKNAPFSVTDVLHSHFPDSMNTATVPFRELMKITGKTPDEIVEALKKEIPGGYSLQPHDFPEQIVSEGRQAEHFWHPKDPAAGGSHDKPFVGFSLRPETGKAIADAKAAINQAPVAPVTSEMPALDAFLATKKNPDDWMKMLEENTEKMIGQGKFHRFSAADFLNDPTHGPMNKAYIDLLKSKGYDVVNLKHNGSDSISGDLVKAATPPPAASPAAKAAAPQVPVTPVASVASATVQTAAPNEIQFALSNVKLDEISKITGKTPTQIKEEFSREFPKGVFFGDGGIKIRPHLLEEALKKESPSDIVKAYSKLEPQAAAELAAKTKSMQDPAMEAAFEQFFERQMDAYAGKKTKAPATQPSTATAAGDIAKNTGNVTHIVQEATHTIPWDEITKATGKTPEEIQKHLSDVAPNKFRFGEEGLTAKRGFDPGTVTSDVASSYAKLSKEAAERYAAEMNTAENIALNSSVNRTWDKNQAKLADQLGVASPGSSTRSIHPERVALSKQADALKAARKAKIEEHAARIAAEMQATHGGDDAIATLAKLRDLKEPNMAVMVPQHQAKQIQRMFSGGPRERLVSETTQQMLDHPEFPNIQSIVGDSLAREQEHGFGLGSELIDPATGRYFPRRESVTAAKQAEKSIEQRGSSALAANTAGDVGREDILKGNYQGSVGVNKVLKDEEIHDAIATQGLKAAEDLMNRKHGHSMDRFYHDAAQRQAIETAAAAKDRLTAKSTAIEQRISDQSKMVASLGLDPANAKYLKRESAKLEKMVAARDKVSGLLQKADAAHIKALEHTTDRIKGLVEYMKANPELKGVDKFGNNPFSDLAHARIANDEKFAMTKAVQNTIRKELNKGDGGMTLREFLEGKGYNVKAMAEKIAGKTFDDAKELKAFVDGNTIDSGLAEQLTRLSPSYKAPADVNEVADKFKSFMSWWKGLTLAFPASRTRDAVGGAVWNMLHGWGNHKFYGDIKKILTGGTVTTDYSHVKEIQDWLKKSGKEWSHETQSEAIRQLIATHIPSSHNILNDIPTGQVGVKKDDFLTVPGREKTTVFNQFIGDPLKTAVGMDGKTSWFGRAEPGDTLVGRAKKAVLQPFTGVRGVGDAKETLFAPVAASEKVAAHSDAYNRGAPFLNLLNQGVDAHIAGRKVNRAQVDYCVDDQTEILTSTGWKKWNELQVGDKSLTIDMEANSITWLPVTAVNVFPEQWRTLHSWQGQGFDALTTNAHRWLCRSAGKYIPVAATIGAGAIRPESGHKRDQSWRWLTSEKIHGHQYTMILGGGIYNTPEVPVISDELVELCGWYVTEGSPANKSGIAIPQSVRHNPHYVERIQKLQQHFASLGATATRWSDHDHGWGPIATFYFGKGIGERVRYELCANKTLTMGLLMSLTGHQLELLYNTILDGDLERRSISSRNGREGARISQKRIDVCESFQTLAAMLGKRTRTVRRQDGMFRLSVYSTPFIHSDSLKESLIEHCGIVWCPTIKTGVWMARRNGCTYWTGNSPDTFSATERAIKNYLLPFYSFNSRILPETARELSNFGSPTSQLVKTVDRAHGGGDPSVPDHIMSGTGIPLGTMADGTKKYMTGLGQMYEPAVSQLGLAAGMLKDPRAAGALMYDTAAMLNPLIGVPLQRMTGQSFFQRGAPIRDMDPIVGRLLSNIGESTGLMEAGSRPVDVPGSAYIDTALGGTPFGRAAGQVRTLFDPRKDMLSKAADTLSGMRVADVSPEKQMATLQKRAEDLARSQGAWEQRTVGFPKEQLAKLALTNPELAAEQQHLQNMITAMKRKRTIHRKAKKAAEKK